MLSDSAPSTRGSVISIDPAVASQITGTTQNTSPVGHSRTGSSPAQRLKTPETTSTSRGHARNRSAPLQSSDTSSKKRSNSLRRAKNSTEVLRNKSTRSSKKPTPLETIPDTRAGRSFTIGNVGIGGVLYLKPSVHQNASLSTSPPGLVPLTAPPDLPSIPYDENFRPSPKDMFLTDSHSTALRSASPKRSNTKRTRRPTTETTKSRHGRSQSVSTVDDQRPSFAGTRTKTLKIVINRPGDELKTNSSSESASNPPKLSLPTLEVPIPHYKIGTPRFSDHGTPMLRNSFNRTSATASDVTVQPQQATRGPPPSNAKTLAKLELSQDRVSWGEDRVPAARLTTSSGSAKTDSTIREPIHPEIYDDLARVYDDPNVVRYSQNVREITAATPARIIAQISSESFMDYELVSDFFLTFRSYMSPFLVLDLLLARLRWAIDRQEDHGRIIRVRTFAALRHWILNYFVDDFIPDRKLRARFCNEINRMYTDVSSRPSHGTSDLKVLRDLKRCWNGRCSMFWDLEDFNLDGEQDEDLHPGGSDDEVPGEPNENALAMPLRTSRAKTASSTNYSKAAPAPTVKTRHERQESTGKQESITSEQSIQAKSCSIPKDLLWSNAYQTADQSGSHPVPVQLRRKNAPSSLQVQTNGHKKGAASIDSDREPTPRESAMTPLQLLPSGSIIRGSVFGPSAPLVQILSSPAVSSAARFETNNLHSSSQRRTGSPNSAQTTPGVKNIFGSLRKALVGRHGHSDMALITVSSPLPVQEAPRLPRTPLPLNMSRSHDELRNRGLAPAKGQIRIDLLCAQVVQSYERLFPDAKQQASTMLQPQQESPVLHQYAAPDVDPIYLTPDLRRDRLPSHATAQSGSILIVNDTGSGVPVMTGALQPDLRTEVEAQTSSPAQAYGLGIAQPDRNSIPAAATQRSSDALGESMTGSPTRMITHDALGAFQFPIPRSSGQFKSPRTQRTASTAGSSTTMRNMRSLQSSPRVEPSLATATSVSMADPVFDDVEEYDDDEDEDSHVPAHALRRKPGGDLRNVENVHDLDRDNHHESLETTTTASGSPIHSFTAGPGQSTRQKEQSSVPEKKAISMINTHSSQHLRPSFEKAVAGFSHIPDDDDGGYEATLMKLEGRYDKSSPPLEQHPVDTAERRHSLPDVRSQIPIGSPVSEPETYNLPRGSVRIEDFATEAEAFEALDQSRKSSIYGLAVGSDGDFDQNVASADGEGSGTTSQTKIIPSPLHLQKRFDKKASQQRLQAELMRGNALNVPRPETANESAQSFLLDEDENLSDLSSEISVDIINYQHGLDRSVSPMIAAPGTAISGLEIPSHPLTYASVVDLAPTLDGRESMLISDARNSQQKIDEPATSLLPVRISGGPAHIPFVLACDSQVLAQQLTLIEKSALTEIEWFDLVDMRWENGSAKILDWAEYLAKENAKGVDMVITRFNLMSRWVRSEIVLTQDLEERAQVMAKFIHVAAHARRLHNYATMVQITIGLTSTDITRLTKTWEKVAGPDRSLLKNMERLIQPIRNFHDLRAEIEGSDLSDGCIPFIGLYVHDLTYNAQKPGLLAGKEGSEPLVNFERYRTAAVIVKGLLRLIDASARYTFEPVKGVVEKCLWLAALSDEKIRVMGRSLEQ